MNVTHSSRPSAVAFSADGADSSNRRRSIPLVWVAEDDREMLRLLTSSLRDDGYEVVAMGNGLELYEALRQNNGRHLLPNLLISDIRMPGFTGLEVLEAIRGWGYEIPVLLITAFGDIETINAAWRLNATAVFNKPFDIDDLRMAVKYFLKS